MELSDPPREIFHAQQSTCRPSPNAEAGGQKPSARPPVELLLGGRLRVCIGRMFVGFGGVLMGLRRVFRALGMIALLVVLCSGFVFLGGVLVMLRGFLVRFVCHVCSLSCAAWRSAL